MCLWCKSDERPFEAPIRNLDTPLTLSIPYQASSGPREGRDPRKPSRGFSLNAEMPMCSCIVGVNDFKGLVSIIDLIEKSIEQPSWMTWRNSIHRFLRPSGPEENPRLSVTMQRRKGIRRIVIPNYPMILAHLHILASSFTVLIPTPFLIKFCL